MSERTDLSIDHTTWPMGGRYIALDLDGTEMGRLVYVESLAGPEQLRITATHVAEPYRRTGVAVGLYRRLINDYPGWKIDSGPRNEEAQALYEYFRDQRAEEFANHADPDCADAMDYPRERPW